MKPYLLLLGTVLVLLLLIPAVIGWILTPAAPTAVTAPAAEQTAAPTETTVIQAETTAAPTQPTANDDFGASLLRVRRSDGSGDGTLTVRDYVIFSLAAELPPDAPTEALQACAVTLYTDAARMQAQTAADGVAAELTEPPLSFPEGYTAAYWQPRWGDRFDACYAAMTTAADAAAGRRILYDGAPIRAARHARNTGETVSAAVAWGQELPYLQAVASPGDLLTAGKPSGEPVGMSLTGACAMAEQGLTCDEILRHYYTGVEVSEA